MAFGISASDVAEACARSPWRMLGCWLLVIGVAAGLAAGRGGARRDDDVTNNPDAARADARMNDRLPDGPSMGTAVVPCAADTVDAPIFGATHNLKMAAADDLAAVELLGNRIRYLPSRRGRLPDLRIDGPAQPETAGLVAIGHGPRAIDVSPFGSRR
jgi:hypothetical protein